MADVLYRHKDLLMLWGNQFRLTPSNFEFLLLHCPRLLILNNPHKSRFHFITSKTLLPIGPSRIKCCFRVFMCLGDCYLNRDHQRRFLLHIDFEIKGVDVLKEGTFGNEEYLTIHTRNSLNEIVLEYCGWEGLPVNATTMVETGPGNSAETCLLYQEPDNRRIVLESTERQEPRVVTQ
jgi:hypothetical protein